MKKNYKKLSPWESYLKSQQKYDQWIKEEMIKHNKEIEENINRIIKEIRRDGICSSNRYRI